MAEFTPSGQYHWTDGSQEVRRVTWKIGRATVQPPTQTNTLTFQAGKAQGPVWSDYAGKLTVTGGTQTATNAGTYQVQFTPTANYQWEDGTYGARGVNWTIGRLKLASQPVQSNSLTYTGSTLRPEWSNYSAESLTIASGTQSATDAGNYTVYFKPTANYTWQDGSFAEKGIQWTIKKAEGGFTMEPSTLTLTSGQKTQTVTVTRKGTGAVSAISNAVGTATVQVDGTTISVTGAASGKTTVTVSVAGDKNYTAPANQTLHVTVSLIKPKLGDNTWPEIKQAVEDGEDLWKVGDTKSVTLTGTIGDTPFKNLIVDAFIIGINHNKELEGDKLIHFQIGLMNGKHVALIDNHNYEYSSSVLFNMNTSDTCEGGWESCKMRTDLLGQDTGGRGATFMSALPSELRDALSKVTKYTDNFGRGAPTLEHVTPTTDYLFLLSEVEVHGTVSNGNGYEKDKQEIYEYYKNGNTIRTFRLPSSGIVGDTMVTWWLRSPGYSYGSTFCCLAAGGDVSGSNANYCMGLSPAFCI